MSKKLRLSIILSICVCLMLTSVFPGLNLYDECEATDAGSVMLSDGRVAFEAENMTLNSQNVVTIENDVNASGEKTLKTTIKRTSGTVDFENTTPDFGFSFVTDVSGHHYMWVRFCTPNESSDSIFCSFNSTAKVQWLTAGKGYYWRKVDSAQLVAGECAKIRFWSREVGVFVDKIVISTSPDFQPVNKDESVKIDFSRDNSGKLIFILPDITPPSNTHPRLVFMQKDIDGIKNNLSAPAILPIWNRIKTTAASSCNAYLDINTLNNQNSNVLNNIVCRAFVYAMGEADESYAYSAISDMKTYLSTLRVNLKTADITRVLGETMMVSAAVYDWCYDRLTLTDKEYFIREMKSYALKKEAGYPPVNQNSLNEHIGEGEVFGHLLSCGIAVYDEEPELYNLAYGRIKDTLLDARKLWVKSGAHAAGLTYGATRFGWELTANQLIMGMGYSDGILGDKSDIAKACKKFVYARLPEGKYMKQGDDWMWCAPSNKSNFWWAYAREIYCLGAYQTDDPFLHQMASLDRNLPNDRGSQLFVKSIIPQVMLIKSNNELTPFDELPLANKTSFPLTQINARTNWLMGSDSNTVTALLDASEKRTLCHDHADRGSFQLYYKGGLAVNAGLYTYKGADGKIYDWGSDYFWNYYTRTVAANCMTVYDSKEEFFDRSGNKLSNDGGQLIPTYSSDYNDYMNKADTTQTKAYYIGPNKQTPEFSFVKTDLSNAYGGHYDEDGNFVKKVKFHERSMVFMDLDNDEYPAALVVFDNIESSDESYLKTWNLNAVAEPEISGSEYTVSNGRGKLVGNVLLPQNPNISLVESAHIDGTVYVAYEREDGIKSEKGTHRLLVSPSEEKCCDLFLNSMYVTDDENTVPLQSVKTETDSVCAVSISDRFVIFPKNGTIVSSVSFDAPQNGYDEVKCLVAGIAPGLWRVEDSGGDVKVYKVENDENTLYFRGSFGKFSLAPIYDVEPDNINYPKMEKKKNGDFYMWNDVKKELVSVGSPSKYEEGVPMASAEDIFASFDFSAGWVCDKMNVNVNGNTFVIDGDCRYAFLNGDIKLLKSSPAVLNNRLYINPTDFLKSTVVDGSNIILLSGAETTQKYNISVKSGNAKIDSLSQAKSSVALTLTARIPQNEGGTDVVAYFVLKKGRKLYTVDWQNVDISKGDGEIKLTLDNLPADIASGDYCLTLYLWNYNNSPYDGYKRIKLLK